MAPSSDERADADESNDAYSLTLQKTAELHEISPSYLSRRVKAGKPAKGHDLTDYAVIEGGRIEGFRFPSGYEFPAAEDVREEAAAEKAAEEGSAEAPGGAREGAVGDGPGGGRPGESPPEVQGRSTKEGEPGPYVDRRPAPGGEAQHGFARSAGQFYAGRPAWGRLQRLNKDGKSTREGGSGEEGGPSQEGGPPEERPTEKGDGEDGGAKYLEYVLPESPVTIERVSEVYGDGRYRLSRLAGGRELHFTFRISRQAPPVVERRLAKIDQIEHRAQLLKEKLENEKAETQRLNERLEEKEQVLEETEEELRRERSGRKSAERKLEWLRQDYDQKVKFEKQKLRREKQEELRKEKAEVRDAKRKLEGQVRELKRELRETKREHKLEINELKREHELEKIHLKNGREDQAIEQIGRFAGKLADGMENNPEITRGLVLKGLQSLGVEDLAQQFRENWWQAAQAEEAATEDASKGGAGRRSSGEESSGAEKATRETEEEPKWSVERAKAALVEQVTGEGELAGPATREDDWWAEVKGRFPRRPENWCHDVICPRTTWTG